MPTSFGQRLAANFKKYGQLCVGIDPHAALLDAWGLSDDAVGLREFAMRALDAAVDSVGIVKPQVSFFERHGSAGFAVLEELATKARQSDVLVIMDAKRGDIGTTMDGYYEAWLSKTAPFACDALTVSPYLGFDSLGEVMSRCQEDGKGLFVLAATSNPEGRALQTARTPNGTLAGDIWSRLGAVNSVTGGPGGSLGDFGAVLGATLDLRALGITLGQASSTKNPILAPGFGAQGAELRDAGRLFDGAQHQLIASVSRSVLAAGQSGMPKAIEVAKRDLAFGLGAGEAHD